MTDPDPESAPPVRAAALDLRVLRALPFATVCVVLAAAGHVLASGDPVPPGALLLGWALVGAVAVSGARRERSARAITGGLAGGQAGLHVLFHLAEAPRRAPARGGTADMVGMPGMAGHSGAAVSHAGHSGAAVSHAAVASAHLGLWCHLASAGLSAPMLLAHAVATVAAGWWLRRGEAAVWALVRHTARTAAAAGRARAARFLGVPGLFAALRDGLDGRSGAGALCRATGPDRSGRARSGVLRHVVVRRGPPWCAAG
ncbi:hypothetical protein ABTZ03_41325 [Kitasatospora sp. NPDC096077]|uniref:hypothetical protein n=1 Tax=Kitasatospora sp. NPDC096077 TaxID=3155544 RepID=UPI00332A1442